MTQSEQIDDLAGGTAVVHGVNTIDSGSRGVHRERFTDVFILEGGNGRVGTRNRDLTPPERRAG